MLPTFMGIEASTERARPHLRGVPASYLEHAVRRWRSGEEALGERLLVLDDAPPVAGAQGGALGLDRQGLAVLVVAAADLPPEELADELTRIATLSEDELARAAGTSPEGLRRLHAEHFRLEGAADPRLNADQRLVLLVDREPSEAWWESAEAELGFRLERVYVLGDGVADPLRHGQPARGSHGWPRWGAAALSALGAAAVAVAVTAAFVGKTETQLPVIEGFVSTVTAGVPGDATHTQWTGQHHVVQTSDDRLHVLYASAGRLHVVTDHGNGGRTWEESIAVPEIRTTGYSAAADGRDRLLLAYTDDQELRFTTLTRESTGWEPGEALVLDESSSSRVVDIAWDGANEVAHVVWAAAGGSGERPQWAAVAPGPRPRLVQSRELAPAGETGSVLVSVVTMPASGVLAAYRRADGGGFVSRTVRPGGASTEFVWGPEEAVPADSNFGSVSLVADRRGVVHLALRDDVDPALLYFRKPAGKAWGRGEVAVAASSVEEADFPVLSVDERSGLVYLFFQNADLDPSPQIRVLVRDPAAGWQGSYQVINPEAVEDGANFPVAAGTVAGSASVLWTRKGPIPQIQIARFLAP